MKRRSYVTVFFLMIFFFATISIAQARGPGRCGPDKGMGREVRQKNINNCLSELNLSSDQIARFRDIRDAHMEKMDRIRGEMHEYRTQKRKLQKVTDVDQKSLETLLDQGSELWKEREREQVQYRQQISALLSQEQKDRLYMCETFRTRPGRQEKPGRW
ncbi:MAG: Spy/CpxP family protein refolding chaperone [bacterium]